MNRRIDSSSLFWGLFLILIGGAFLADRFDLVEVRHWWPLFLVALGASRLFGNQNPWSGVSLILVGLWLQASVSHLWGMNFGSSWPLLLIALGASMVVRTFFEGLKVRHGNE